MYSKGRMNRRAAGFALAGLIWLGAVLAGFAYLASYGSVPGASAAGRSSRVQPPSEIVLFLHPKCPCGQATLTELERILAEVTHPVAVNIWFVTPKSADPSWDSGLVARAQSIVGVHVRFDPGGRLARDYGVRTSGQLFLFDKAGRLAFQGGITDARAHEGDNDGMTAVVDFVDHGRTSLTTAPVYGCPMGDLGAP